MWRSLLKCFRLRKQTRPAAPRVDPDESFYCAGYQDESDNSCFLVDPTYEQLRARGFGSPSSSDVSSSPNNLPWFVASSAGRKTIASHLFNDVDNDDQVDSAKCPLKRVLAIGRREGECIRRRRRIHKFISPEELVEGLGMMLVDRSTSVAFQVRIHSVRQMPKRIIVEIEDDDSDEE